MGAPRTATTLLLTGATLAAFAGNSLLCRAGLRSGDMDPLAFTGLRLVAGAAVMAAFAFMGTKPGTERTPWSVAGALTLFVYAVAFSLAYLTLDAGVGALILFGAVQVTMVGASIDAGDRPSGWQWIGLALALSGLVWLVAPGATAPAPISAALMALAGVAWGAYSLIGRGVPSPTRATARNFVLAAVPGLGLAFASSERIDSEGLWYAVLSGALTSGLGYVIWYAALRGLSRTSAAVVQLAVPIVAAAGGVAFLGEPVTPRLIVAGAVTLGGVALAILSEARRS